MAKEFILRVVFCFSLSLLLLLAPPVSFAHLDPPGKSPYLAYQEIIKLYAVDVKDDMDATDSGELFLEYEITQPNHNTASGRIPPSRYVSLESPNAQGKAVRWSFRNPIVIYDHLNCVPLERMIAVKTILKDIDGTLVEESKPLTIFVGEELVRGDIGVGNETFNFYVRVEIVPRPEYDKDCKRKAIDDSDQPSSPSSEDSDSEIPPREGGRKEDIESLLFGEKKDYRKSATLAVIVAGIAILVAMSVIRKRKKKHKKRP